MSWIKNIFSKLASIFNSKPAAVKAPATKPAETTPPPAPVTKPVEIPKPVVTPTGADVTPEQFRAELLLEANKWVGVHEKGGNNKGPEVEEFQRAVDGKASGEAWCLAFQQFILKKVEAKLKVKSGLYNTEHCMTLWNKNSAAYGVAKPKPGCWILWNHANTSSGHVGMVEFLEPLRTIEGNTGPDKNRIQADGDGVYKKDRHLLTYGDMKFVGYIDPAAHLKPA